jgi:hypothetical protein
MALYSELVLLLLSVLENAVTEVRDAVEAAEAVTGSGCMAERVEDYDR